MNGHKKAQNSQNLFRFCVFCAFLWLYSGDCPFKSLGERTNVPPTGIEYVNVLRVSPFILTGIGRPDVSKTSMRPASVALLLFTQPTSVAQPPAIPTRGTATGVAPPTL